MTHIFLGYPPEHIARWMEHVHRETGNQEHMNPPPPVEVETWVPARNPDGSPLSDIEHAEWVFSDGNAHNAMLLDWREYGDGIYWIIDRTRGMSEPVFCISNDGSLIPRSMFTDLDEAKTAVQIHKTDIEYGTTLIAYRKFTPSHWEDADGNWINGNWGEWESTSSLKPEWHEKGEAEWCHESGWYKPATDILINKNENVVTYFVPD